MWKKSKSGKGPTVGAGDFGAGELTKFQDPAAMFGGQPGGGKNTPDHYVAGKLNVDDHDAEVTDLSHVRLRDTGGGDRSTHTPPPTPFGPSVHSFASIHSHPFIRIHRSIHSVHSFVHSPHRLSRLDSTHHLIEPLTTADMSWLYTHTTRARAANLGCERLLVKVEAAIEMRERDWTIRLTSGGCANVIGRYASRRADART